MSPTILTHGGNVFNLLHPEQCIFAIEDIAHALSNLCRFTGHTREFYSVAQHSVHVSHLAPKEHALAGLLHDAAEAYLGDVASPLKALLPAYKEIEVKVEQMLLSSFGLDIHLPPSVKQADMLMLVTERRDLMPLHVPYAIPGGFQPLPGVFIQPWSPAGSKHAFLARFKELTS